MAGIFGVDHICLSCPDVTAHAHEVNRLGFDTLFEEKALPVSDKKRGLLRNYTPFHDMAFLKAKKGVSIEMIAHQVGNGGNAGPYNVLLGAGDEGQAATGPGEPGMAAAAMEEAFKSRVVKCRLPGSNFHYYRPADAAGLINGVAGVAAVTLECHDIERSSVFWEEGLGLRLRSFSSTGILRWRLLEFVSPVPAWCLSVLLVENRALEKNKYYLDDPGWTCLSFIASDMEDALSGLASICPVNPGDAYDLRVGGRDLRLCFLRGPDEEIIEIISPSRANRRTII